VEVGEYGTHVAWSDDVDMAASTLWRLALEQSGATMTADDRRMTAADARQAYATSELPPDLARDLAAALTGETTASYGDD